MNKIQKWILIIHMVMIILFGILLVPFKLVYGPERMIFDLKYAPLWSLVDKSNSVNGFNPVYELQTSRLIYTVLVLTILGAIGFLLASNFKNKIA
ncbi:hypothetical protein P4H27_27590 [Paenibacillus taichungensis]|uniref:hypothetical protein n=1 Tax=Paenibacillus taichungensis TaxID=484184 RepID=UPI002DBD5683|nr:hypothetical protein [Paenibacillus taichungensis]MEC0110728.1 hypothetical protein [Paenibacillus taichungensis]MEC0197944.1 hypothetical protein [Paenibacillus taichungensis]